MELTTGRKVVLGIQHVFAMFGATVLVPILTGLDPSLALLSAGIGTLLFHWITGWKVPVFLGSSFAFIGAIQLTMAGSGIAAVKGGIIGAGLVYVVMAGVIRVFGIERVKSFFPPIVTGPVIVLIGLRLSPVAINGALFDADGVFSPTGLLISAIVVFAMILVSMFAGGFFKLVPILVAVVVGYLVSLPFGLVNTDLIGQARWLGFNTKAMNELLTLPSFDATALLAIAPIAIVVFVEHIGDITTNGAVVGKDFFTDPGIHRTMLGDGVGTLLAGLIGGPANTTYSENTGVLAVTKVYDPAILRIAAVFAIALSLLGKFGAIIQAMPGPVMGGISMILFGMIASVGVRTMMEADLNFAHSRNLIITALILVLGIGIGDIMITGDLSISGLAIAAIVGIILNKALPEGK